MASTTNPGLNARRMAFFISTHGFGHAARAAAVMAALRKQDAALDFDIFSQVPHWFFERSGLAPFTQNDVFTDVGFIQTSPLKIDPEKTLATLNHHLPFERSTIDSLADRMRSARCALAVCDISPLGILAAEKAGVPSVLVENFTWDWLYQPLLKDAPTIQSHMDYLHVLFKQADYHIQTEPVCRPCKADLHTGPASRALRYSRERTRNQLGIPDTHRLVLISMGGIADAFPFLDQLQRCQGVTFIVSDKIDTPQHDENVVRIPRNSDFFHPDLVNAADALIGKAGYSTLAEAFNAGTPFGYINRSDFRESPILAKYIKTHMSAVAIETHSFYAGDWLKDLDKLLALPRTRPNTPNGADEIASFLLRLI